MLNDLRDLVGLLFITLVILACGFAGVVWFAYDYLKDIIKEPK